ncbi:hypothetical protein BMS3Bbin11_00976 [bacterium BMS3Bbin11]|nr:hypothetical protein BMS3Abin11_01477 [bacterium BMS3Abin11]GBE45883.1 hypothetical protein BMS3Bbin11_00976 [bacterium BMS3Bbin11]HDH16444.1 DUF2065 domain-containing protein [Gammaproteobacteria bacterium]HDZ78996.1 DUF2065 domain-containing protein [Gammaproteobacteria bacterium]
MAWYDFFTAIALMLIFEGILPFLNPDRYRKMLEMMEKISNNHLRTMGLIVTVVGVVLLTLVRAGSGS